MINRVILIGNLGKDPEVRRLENGTVVAKFSMATSENYKDASGEWKTATEWHDVVVWRQLAEKAESRLKKGIRIYVEGKLTHRRWEDSNGNNRKTTEVVANYFRVLQSKPKTEYFPNEEPAYMQPADVPAAEVTSLQQQSEQMPPPTGDDDLPF